MFSTKTPSLADITLYYQLLWGTDIAAGRGIQNLTGGEAKDTDAEGATSVFNANRYPSLYKWFYAVRDFLDNLPSTATVAATPNAISAALQLAKDYVAPGAESLLIPTPNETHFDLDRTNGLVPGTRVSVAPDDTGRDEYGMLISLTCKFANVWESYFRNAGCFVSGGSGDKTR